MAAVFTKAGTGWRSLDYVAGWFSKAAEYGSKTSAVTALVSTNSICQGVQVPILWPLIFATGHKIVFAHTSFKWANLASHNAGVTVAIVGISTNTALPKVLYSTVDRTEINAKQVSNINAYLTSGPDVIVQPLRESKAGCAYMDLGNMAKDGGHLLLSCDEAEAVISKYPAARKYIFDFVGSQEFIKGIYRKCLWIDDASVDDAISIPFIAERLKIVREMRLASDAQSTREFADRPHRFKGSLRVSS